MVKHNHKYCEFCGERLSSVWNESDFGWKEVGEAEQTAAFGPRIELPDDKRTSVKKGTDREHVENSPI